MIIRPFHPCDADPIARLFHDTVHLINLRDYSPDQLQAWAPADIHFRSWTNLCTSRCTFVADDAGAILGFADLEPTGHLDHLYVHHQHQRRRVGSTLHAAIEAQAVRLRLSRLFTEASITARPFFLRVGYRMLHEQTVTCRGAQFINFAMEKPLTHPRRPLVEDSPVPATPQLEQCLNRVEFYQPLYGITGFEPPLRSCRDRTLAIEAALAPIPPNLRLIDFGSSLGYFPFYFADRGATTTGWDIQPQNTAVALATQQLTGLPATFRTAALDLQTTRDISPGQFDAALILSVLHHLTHQQGLDYVARLLAELLSRIPTLILELAHRDEAVTFPWRSSLPQDPLAILSACGQVQVRELGRFPSHLSAATRPMYLITR